MSLEHISGIYVLSLYDFYNKSELSVLVLSFITLLNQIEIVEDLDRDFEIVVLIIFNSLTNSTDYSYVTNN